MVGILLSVLPTLFALEAAAQMVNNLSDEEV